MISFNDGNKKFNFRVAGLAIHNGKVLLHQYEGFDFYALPGGRAEMGEDTIETLIREFKEELDETIEVERLLWCSETFYDHRGFEVHELCMYYLVRFSSDSNIVTFDTSFERIEIDGTILTFTWVPMEEVINMDVYPMFVRNNITSLPTETTHIIEK